MRRGLFFKLIRVALLSVSFWVMGCVSSRISDRAVDHLFMSGRYEEAAQKLEAGIKSQGEKGRDILLYLLDYGLTLHAAGKFDESNRIFLQADKMAEIKDYTSLAAEGSSLVTSENIKDYKAEDFENVLINTYLAMNFALLGDHENALVEARRVNRKLYLMVNEGARKYKQNAFARYLSAVIYEADKNWNDAYIDYKKTWELDPGFPGLGRDLWRLAYFNGMREEMERWDREFKLTRDDHEAARALDPRKGKSEIIVLFENGYSPEKEPHPNFRTIPKFYPRFNPVTNAKVELNGKVIAETAKLHDIEATAIQNLDDKYAGIIAKKVAGMVAKEVVADQVERRTGSEVAGAVTRMILYSIDQADLRSWKLLPKDLQIARIPVDPGTYTVRLQPNGGGGLPEKAVQVTAGKKIFVNFRYTPGM